MKSFIFFILIVRIFLVTNDVTVNFLKIWFVTVLKSPLYILNYKLQFRTVKNCHNQFQLCINGSILFFFFLQCFSPAAPFSLLPYPLFLSFSSLISLSLPCLHCFGEESCLPYAIVSPRLGPPITTFRSPNHSGNGWFSFISSLSPVIMSLFFNAFVDF